MVIYVCNLITLPFILFLFVCLSIYSDIDIFCSAVPPNIIDSESTQSTVAIRENQNITLTCRADGFPTPKIMWRREDGQGITVERRKKGKCVYMLLVLVLLFVCPSWKIIVDQTWIYVFHFLRYIEVIKVFKKMNIVFFFILGRKHLIYFLKPNISWRKHQ